MACSHPSWFLLSLPGILTTWSILTQYSIEYGNTGIEKRFPVNKKILNWSEVERVEFTIFKVSLKTKKKIVFINLLIYKEPKEVIDFITRHMEQ